MHIIVAKYKHVFVYFSLGRAPAPAPPRRDPRTTLSVGRARAKSMVAGLGMYITVNYSIIYLLNLKLKKIICKSYVILTFEPRKDAK